MKYLTKNLNSPEKIYHIDSINSAAERLHDKIKDLEIEKLDISPYFKRYLKEKKRYAHSALQLYSYLLALSLGSRKTIDNFVFIEYGGGTGIFSMLAKETGVGKVIYNDIYDVSCQNFKTTTEKLNLKIDDIVCGDVDTLTSFTNEKGILVDAIGSYDVLEHIYDIESFFKQLKKVSHESLRIVFGSGANPKNLFIKNSLSKMQIEVENINREKTDTHKERDSVKSYLEIRKDIIRENCSTLKSDEINMLAEKTRGLIKKDIINCIKTYKDNGKIPYSPDHPTNTCDPYTGNWAEHLINLNWLKDFINQEYSEVDIMAGYWRSSPSPYKGAIKNLMNIMINILGRKALFLSQYYILYAKHLTD